MKILITQESFPPDIIGGAETLTLKTIEGLQKRGHSIEVLCSGNPEVKEYKGIPTTRIPINRYLMNLVLPIIAKKAKDADIIHTSSGNICFSSWMASKLTRTPICCYIHHIFGSNWRIVRGEYVGRVFQCLEQFYLTRSYNAVIFQNQLSKKIGLDMGIDEKRIFLLKPGVDYKKFQMRNIKKEPFVLFVGNFSMNKPMVEIKGLEYLIKSARILEDVEFVVVGSGNYLNELKKICPQNVVFTGPLTGKPLIELYNKALVFCLPSLTEGFGLVLLEAMASGCAIVSTVDIGQKGKIVKPKSTIDIVRAIKYYIDDPNKAKKMGKENRELAKKCTWKVFIKKLENIYDLIGSKE